LIGAEFGGNLTVCIFSTVSEASIVPSGALMIFWEQVAPLLQKAADKSLGRYNLEDIHDLLTHYDYQLFVAYEHETILAAAVVNAQVYPRKTLLNVAFVGGVEPIEPWGPALLDLLQVYARGMGYDGIETQARLGWSKKLIDNGYSYKRVAEIFEIEI